MALVLIGFLPAVTGILVLMAALMLSLGGAVLVTYSTRSSGEELARRVRLVQPVDRDRDRAAEKLAATATLTRTRVGGPQERDRSEISRRLARFGVSQDRAETVYLGIRFGFVLFLGGFLFVALPYTSAFAGSRPFTALVSVGGAIGGWFIPAILLRRFVKRHIAQVVSSLPDALELLVICVEAGLSLEDSLTRIVREMKETHPSLAAELALTSADLKILPSRDQAFAHFASRVDVPSIRSVVTTLSQTMRFGTPLAQALRVVASEMRNDSLLAMEGRANKLPALLTVPMMLFIMPTIFLIVGGPAALRVADTLLK
jgi:tight adherence protein C